MAVWALVAATPASAQSSDALTPERVFGDPNLNGPTPRAIRFSPDGRAITTLRPRPDDNLALDLWSERLDGGGARRLIDSRALAPNESNLSEFERARRERMRVSAHGVVEYGWDEDGSGLLAPVAGDLYYAPARGGGVRRLTRTPSDEVDARLSHHGRFAVFVRDQNLYVIDVSSGAERALTRDGGEAISYGLADFIAQEELDRFSGYWISPDDTRIAFTRTDETAVPIIPRADINADGVVVMQQRYPRAGSPNTRVELFVAPVAGGEPARVDLGSNADIYLARVDWSKDGATLYVERLSRDQRTLDLLAVDPRTGASRVLLSEHDDHWINLNDDFRPLRDGGFLWTSERDGFAHIYAYDAAGRLQRQVTSDPAPVHKVVGVDERRGYVYYESWRDTPLERQLFRASYKTEGPALQITRGAGRWAVTMNEDATAFIATYSDPRTPPQTALYRADGQRIRWIEENRLDASHPFAPYANRYPPTRYGSFAAPDEPATQLYYRIDLPVGFDPSKRYPAIVMLYGGPHTQYVTYSWPAMSRRLFQEHGYVVFSMDNRGSAERGHAFETALGGRFGDVETRDQIAGLAFLRGQPFVEAGHVGVWGWSYGGYMTLMLMTRYPDAFNAGAAFAPVTDWTLYDTAYTERYLGKPQDHSDIYDQSSPLTNATRIARPLLIVHGMADDNVPFDNSTRFIAALQAHAIPFEMMTYPGKRHGISGKQAGVHWETTLLNFFDRHLQER
ncbi:MAG TPA: S9 family peptidase [Caulobacterales bacterium]|nr:S9 family peptidase [Caulobacterales bacterium]